MNETQKGVREFHRKHKHLINTTPVLPSVSILLLRVRLIIEEAAEFAAAASKDDIPGMVDALGDILYVTYGAALCLGVDMEPVCREIQQSNMTKSACQQDSAGKVQKGKSFELPDIIGELLKQGM